jgi:hypothetical protein
VKIMQAESHDGTGGKGFIDLNNPNKRITISPLVETKYAFTTAVIHADLLLQYILQRESP